MRSSLACAVLIALGSSLSISQTPLLQIEGPPSQLSYFTSGDEADIDNDGVPDIIAGTLYGHAVVYSGVDGALIHTLTSTLPNPGLAVAASAGDVNGDGTNDIVVGFPRDVSGQAIVYSGVDGSPIHVFNSPGGSTYYDFAMAVDGAGDVNGDGFADIIVGIPGPITTGLGRARVYSGANGAVIFTSIAPPAGTGEYYGTAVSYAGDVNADGFADVIVGSAFPLLGTTVTGSRVRVVSGLDGTTLHEYTSTQDRYGRVVGDAGDIDGDGYDDFFFTDYGNLRVYSGQTGANLLHVNEASLGVVNMGEAASRAGDINGDGVEDFSVYAKGSPAIPPLSSPQILIVSGTDGSLIHAIPTTNSEFGLLMNDLAGGRDMDGDGVADIVYTSAWGFSGTTNAMIVVFSGATLARGVYPGTGEGVDLSVTVDGNPFTGSVGIIHGGSFLSAHIEVPTALELQPLLLAGQMFTTASGMPSLPGHPLYFDLSAVPGLVVLWDNTSLLFGTTSIPGWGVDVPLGMVPPGMVGLSISLQAASIAGPLAANGAYAASEATEVRLR
jgi:hypothetical protein